ncbi:MAG: S-adenosylmethionine:tRNA ribosyltransferase-isomerase, partial [Deltaproteobacteria bacterium]|nr:S-adenosylmethionine:tRNA ribosyltransferase-isomerase [Deltaproteobacteria bacterium]
TLEAVAAGAPMEGETTLFILAPFCFQAVDALVTNFHLPRSTLLAGGDVLLVGGSGQGGMVLDTAEVCTAAGTVIPTGRLSQRRIHHTATLLPGGRVLVAGGQDAYSGASLRSTEVYDPTSRAFGPGPDMTAARSGHTATLVATAAGTRVLIAGGSTGSASGIPAFLASAETFDPALLQARP